MTREQLEHAIRAACDIAGDTELIVFGSQAILGTYPRPPESLAASIEVDVQPKNHPERTDDVDGMLGELSDFHITHGFYVHGVTIDCGRSCFLGTPPASQGEVMSMCDKKHLRQ